MEPKEYQIKTLNRVKHYLDLLYDWRCKNDEFVREFGSDASVDFPLKAWNKLEGMYDVYHSRKDGSDP